MGATRIARSMVMQYGMSPKAGLTFNSDQDFEKLSPEQQRTVDEETKRLLDEAYARVTKLMKAKESKLHKLALEMLAKENLTGKEVYEALSLVPPKSLN